MSAAPTLADAERTLVCERCGVAFGCTRDANNCWCAEESYRMPMPAEGSDCLCPDCLRAAAADFEAKRSA